MITVANCLNIGEALSLRIALDSHGIESFVPDENMATATPHLLFGSKSGVRVQVAEEDVERATTVIAEARSSDAVEPAADSEESS
jgi:hypothetical protein